MRDIYKRKMLQASGIIKVNYSKEKTNAFKIKKKLIRKKAKSKKKKKKVLSSSSSTVGTSSSSTKSEIMPTQPKKLTKR